MNARLIAACLILLALPLGGIVCRAQTCAHCDEALTHVDRAAAHDGAPLLAEIDEALAVWHRSETFFCCIVTHEEVDSVRLALERARALGENGELAEYHEALAEARGCILIVRAFDAPTLRNIF